MELFLIIAFPVLCAILIPIIGSKSRFVRNTLILAPSIVDFLLVGYLAAMVTRGGSFTLNLADFPFFAVKFKAEPFAVYMALSMTFLWVMTNIYSFGYMAHEHAQIRYYMSLTLCLSAAMGVLFATNMVTFFIFFEFLTIAVYPLVIHEESPQAYRAGVMYGVYLLTGGAAVLLGLVIVYNLTGNINFVPGGIPELSGQSRMMLTVLFILFTFGFGFKSALFPLHSWLPEAMIAPTPISAVLHAVAVVNVGLLGFYRVIYNIFGIELYRKMSFGSILMFMGAFTILFAAIQGLRQKEIKRMLAMSTINQLSFVLVGIVSFDKIGMLGGLLHIYYHAFMKITLFYCAGAIITQSGNKYVNKMAGLARHMPIVMTCFAITALGIIGLPPVAGWISKWYILEGYFSHGHAFVPLVLILSGILELGFFAPPIFAAFFNQEENGAFHFQRDTSRLGNEAPVTMWLPIVITAAFSLIFGFLGFVPHYLAGPALASLLGRSI